MSEGAEAWVTLATNDSYAMGALVVARSLRRVNTSKKIAVMITPGVSGAMRDVLTDVFDVVTEVNILDSEDAAHLALLDRPELGITFTKIHCWKLTQFSKCVFLDADTLVIQNSDELFAREELSAAPDPGWPDCFNSGVFVFTPSLETYDRIHSFARSHGSFDGGDQGLLNMYFSGWSQADASRRLPFIYNMVASASYSYLPAFKVFGQNVKIVHFIGQDKPWLIYYDTSTGLARAPGGQEHLQDLLQGWWDIFRSEVHPRLSTEMGGGQNQSATMVEQVQASFSQIFVSAEPSASHFSFHQPPPPPVNYPPPPGNYYQPPPQSSHSEQQQQSHNSFIPENQASNDNHAPPPPVDQPPPPPPEPTLLVAIQRFPPDHFWREPPPPPPHIPEYKPPPPPPSPPPVSSHEHFDHERHHHHTPPQNTSCPPPTDNQQHGQSANAQTSTDGGSGSPQQDSNSCNHSNREDSHYPNNGPRQQYKDSSKGPLREEKQRRKKRSKPKGIAAVYAKISLEGGKSIEQVEYEDQMRKMAWEQGHIDYMGKDSFDNIMKRIQTSMAQTSVQKPQRKQTPPQREVPLSPSPATAAPEQLPPKQESVEPPQPPKQEVVEPTPPPKQEAVETPQPTPKQDVVEPTPPPKQEAVVTSQPPPPKQEPDAPPKQEAVVAPQPPPKQDPPSQPEELTAKAQKQTETVETPVVEEKIQASSVQTQAAPPSSEQTAQEEDRKAQVERQAVEKKLAEQKIAAEQKLEAEKQAAAARAAASAPKSAPKAEEPKAPPRKESSQNGPPPAVVGNASPYGVGLGILGAAVVLVFAIYAAYSPTSFVL